VSEENLYLMTNREKLEAEQGGKYIALYKNKVIAVGKTLHEVYAEK